MTKNVFAADIWETYSDRAVPEYKDPDMFFKKTFMTEG
jgi:predicted AAA+ superfamily ATPase